MPYNSLSVLALAANVYIHVILNVLFTCICKINYSFICTIHTYVHIPVAILSGNTYIHTFYQNVIKMSQVEHSSWRIKQCILTILDMIEKCTQTYTHAYRMFVQYWSKKWWTLFIKQTYNVVWHLIIHLSNIRCSKSANVFERELFRAAVRVKSSKNKLSQHWVCSIVFHSAVHFV